VKSTVSLYIVSPRPGKSTQIPQYLADEGGWAEQSFQIAVTQPRRLAAQSLARRVAHECGDSTRVGYTVRFDCQPSTHIQFLTDGVLLRDAVLNDPLLSKYSVVMMDEAHERTLQSDALLGLLQKIRRKRPSLRLIVCSATIDAQGFLEFLTKDPSEGTILSVDGRLHSVDIMHTIEPKQDYLQATVETAWQIHKTEEKGDVLCFLPSYEEIDRAIRMAEERFRDELEVDFLPLHGSLPAKVQARVFTPSHRRRIIFSTNIAETSVTVPDIAFVIDAGLVKLPYFDPRTGLERLITGPISQASAQQRSGRAGRVSAGKCYRLYTEEFLQTQMLPQTPPEILRTNLSSFILTLKALGVDNILGFDLMDMPSVDALSHGLELLFALKAIDEQTKLTEEGLKMSAFPAEPPVAKMLLASLEEACSWEICGVAAALQSRELRPKPHGTQQKLEYEAVVVQSADSSGDHVTYANLISDFEDRGLDAEDCKEKFINFQAMKRTLEVRNQLAKFLRRFGRVRSLGTADENSRSKTIRKCVTAGFFFNVAKLANDGRYYTMRKSILVIPALSSVMSLDRATVAQYILFGETVDGRRGGIELRHVSAIEAVWLRELAPHYFK